MIISLIVAMTKTGIIGKNNRIPWNSKEDMNYFKEKTMGKPIIMGRKTYDSLRIKPLPNRFNVVVTNNSELINLKPVKDEGPVYVNKLAEAIDLCDGLSNEIVIIGGAQIYADALNLDLVDRMYINVMKNDAEGDTIFPFFDRKLWNYEKVQNSYNDFEALIYTRIRNPEDFES